MESNRLEKEYIKQPIKVGHSWGITFPKEIAQVFNLDKPHAKLKLMPNVAENKIEIFF